MKDIILKAENISKQYRLGQVGTGTLSHDLNRWWHQVRGKEDPYLRVGESNDRSTKGESDYVWALQDINFEVERGEVLGIIGKNGAGKSTLLKILSKVTAPTTGNIKYNGRIASLLEVGTGFNGEMTGRENIFLNGAILGMTKKEIALKLDEIVEFSGCERYIDTPVKRYSSGMTVRLAFAVAAFLEPEILVVDEVLAVGDVEFQKKAIGKMQDISRGGGRTVLFVSHNMAAVQNLCTRGLLLENGGVSMIGPIESIIEKYVTSNSDKASDELIVDLSTAKRSNGKIDAIKKAWLENENGDVVNSVEMGKDFTIKFEFDSDVKEIENALFGFGIENSLGIRITSLNNEISGDEIPVKISKGTVAMKVKNPNIMLGLYFVSISIVSNQNEWVDYIEHAISFEIIASDVYNSGKIINNSQGIFYLNGNVSCV